MSVGVLEIEPAAAIIVVDRTRPALAGIRPVLDAALADAREDLIELVLADQERIMLGGDLAIRVVEVERYRVAELDHQERSEPAGWRQPEHLGEKSRRLLLVAAPDDGVVEFCRHLFSSLHHSFAQAKNFPPHAARRARMTAPPPSRLAFGGHLAA